MKWAIAYVLGILPIATCWMPFMHGHDLIAACLGGLGGCILGNTLGLHIRRVIEDREDARTRREVIENYRAMEDHLKRHRAAIERRA